MKCNENTFTLTKVLKPTIEIIFSKQSYKLRK